MRGVWDSLYSSAWLDGTLSGSVRSRWNWTVLLPLAWVGVPLTAAACAGAFVPVDERTRKMRRVLVAATVCVLASIVFTYMRFPVYTTAKATYALGLLPAFGTLMALGLAPVLRNRTGAAAELSKWVRRNRSLAASLAGMLVLTVGGAVLFAVTQRDAAVEIAKQRDRAVAEARRAVGMRLSAVVPSLAENTPSLAAAVALEGARRAPGPEARSALLAASRRTRSWFNRSRFTGSNGRLH